MCPELFNILPKCGELYNGSEYPTDISRPDELEMWWYHFHWKCVHTSKDFPVTARSCAIGVQYDILEGLASYYTSNISRKPI